MTVQLRKWLFLSDYADILNRGYLYGEVSALENHWTLHILDGIILYICVIRSTSTLVMEYYYILRIYVFTACLILIYTNIISIV